jgi:hypothetical protein
LAGYEHTDRSLPRRHLAPAGDRIGRVTGAGVRPGEPQVFDSLTVSCRGCGRAIPPGEVFTRYPTPDDRRRDLTSPFCQTCRPIRPPEPAAEPATTQDLLGALRRGLERQAQTESGTES